MSAKGDLPDFIIFCTVVEVGGEHVTAPILPASSKWYTPPDSLIGWPVLGKRQEAMTANSPKFQLHN